MSSHRQGAVFGLLAAALFGLSAPLAKLLLPSTPPLLLAALLYLGGGLALSTAGRLVRSEQAPPTRADLPLLMAIVFFGGIAGPFLLLQGLTRLSGVTASLLLTLEGPLTATLAVLLFREHLSRRGGLGAALIFGGGLLLAYRPTGLHVEWRGVLCLVGACLAWAVDNNLTQRLSLRDPVQTVRLKALGAAGCMLLLSLVTHQHWPALTTVGLALLLGSFSYGISIVLDVYALRLLGAAQEAAYFATAPFLGAVGAVILLHERPLLSDGAGATAMVLGVATLLRDRHSHRHAHEPLAHEHAHVHDAHHQHAHLGPVTEPHTHAHQHEPLTHEHPHDSDLHHRHEHR